MTRLVFTAAPYGYGPTSKVLCIAEALAGRYEMTYVGMEPGISLAREFPFCDVIEIKDRDTWSPHSLGSLKNADLLITALDYRVLPLARGFGVPSVFVDTLLWLRDAPPPHAELVSRYIAQRFPAPASVAASLLGNRVREVGPLLPACLDGRPPLLRSKSERPQALVCVGGLRSPAMAYAADINYVHLILALLKRGTPPGTQVTLALPHYIRHEVLATLGERSDYLVCYPTQTQFYELLRTTDVLLTTPGLEVVYEAAALGVPMVFLPPYNGTQLFQAQIYAPLGIALHHVIPSWAHSTSLDSFGDSLNEITREVQARNALLVGRANRELVTLSDGLLGVLGNAFSSREIIERTRCAASRLMSRLGRNGRETAAALVASALQQTAIPE